MIQCNGYVQSRHLTVFDSDDSAKNFKQNKEIHISLLFWPVFALVLSKLSFFFRLLTYIKNWIHTKTDQDLHTSYMSYEFHVHNRYAKNCIKKNLIWAACLNLSRHLNLSRTSSRACSRNVVSHLRCITIIQVQLKKIHNLITPLNLFYT